ncbi:MAG: ankyrin repeat domain-containing protein [Xanthomonadales bacterium]|nr:ankyrin repeat domain-containing protein [Xanthomonadales bacterium]
MTYKGEAMNFRAGSILLSLLLLPPTVFAADDPENLLDAVGAGDIEQARRELAGGVPSEGTQARCLITAVNRKDRAMIEALLAAGFEVDARGDDPNRSTATMYAAYTDQPELLEVLESAGADLDLPDAIGDPAINWAVFAGSRAAVEWLVARAVRLDQVGHGNAVQIAKRRGFTDLTEMLCRRSGCNDAVPAPVAALAEAIDEDDAERFNAQFRPGLASSLDETGRPLLHRAARLGRTAMVRTMLEAEADPNLRDDIGFTPLMEAAREGHADLVELLLAAGGSAVARAHASALEFSVLHLAAIGGDPAIVRRMVAAGAALDAQDTDGSTALLWAVGEGRQEAVAELLELGADPDIANRYGYAPAALMSQ